MIRNNGTEKTWYLPEAAEEMHEKPQSELLVFQPRYVSRIQGRRHIT